MINISRKYLTPFKDLRNPLKPTVNTNECVSVMGVLINCQQKVSNLS